MAAAGALKEQIREEYATLLDNFNNLLRSARIEDGEPGSGRQQARVPGEVMEVFAEKMLQACHGLLGVIAELKRNALLNDVAGRNAEVAGSAAEAEGEAAALRLQFQALQQRIDAAMQMLPSQPASEPAGAAMDGAADGAAEQQADRSPMDVS